MPTLPYVSSIFYPCTNEWVTMILLLLVYIERSMIGYWNEHIEYGRNQDLFEISISEDSQIKLIC